MCVRILLAKRKNLYYKILLVEGKLRSPRTNRKSVIQGDSKLGEDGRIFHNKLNIAARNVEASLLLMFLF